MNQEKLLTSLRAALDLPNDSLITDSDILEATDGTLMRSRIELYLELRDKVLIMKREINKLTQLYRG